MNLPGAPEIPEVKLLARQIYMITELWLKNQIYHAPFKSKLIHTHSANYAIRTSSPLIQISYRDFN